MKINLYSIVDGFEAVEALGVLLDSIFPDDVEESRAVEKQLYQHSTVY